MRHFLVSVLLTSPTEEGYITMIINTKGNKHFSLGHIESIVAEEYTDSHVVNIQWFKELSESDAKDFNSPYDKDAEVDEDIKTCVGCGVSYAEDDRDTDVTGYCSFKCMLNDVS
tara:strand:- start:173 stop:514 length:342 start_codon:yes stop_codon:yes gene_type:complete